MHAPSCVDVTFPVQFCDMKSATKPAMAIRDAVPRSFVRVATLPGSEAAARKAASRAVANGELMRVRKGLYYKGAKTRYGTVKPRVEDVVREVLGRQAGFGPAGFSAARMLGLTTQVPARMHVAALKTVESIDGVEQHKRSNLRRADLTEREVAVLEILRAPESYVEGGFPRFVHAVANLLESGGARWEVLRKVVEGEHNTAVRANFQAVDSRLAMLAAA